MGQVLSLVGVLATFRAFFPIEIQVRADAEGIGQHRNQIPYNHRSRSDQQAVIDPQDLNTPMIAAILGFIPALDRRLNIETKSGTAANVVPKPARNPMSSDR
jgi:hypothetical protein